MREFKSIVLLFVLLSTHVVAQQLPSCPQHGDDSYGVNPCCTPPPLPAFQIPILPSTGINDTAQWAYIADCGTAVVEDMTINIKMNPSPTIMLGTLQGMVACDDVLFQVTATNAANTFGFTIGSSLTSLDRANWLLGKYTRTWLAPDEEGYPRQYYRFLISGDAAFTGGTSPTQTPPCISPFSTVMMWGYIDLSCRTNISDTTSLPTNYQASLVLTHYDGCQSHLVTPANQRSLPPGDPRRHDGASYHLVAPNDFNFGATSVHPINLDFSATTSDAIRSTVSRQLGFLPPGPLCLSESALTATNSNVSINCICGSGSSVRYFNQTISGVASCPSMPSTRTWGVALTVPEIPTGFFELQIGAWNSTARFDVRDVSPMPILGTIDYYDICDPRTYPPVGGSIPAEVNLLHIVYGINTFFSNSANRPTLFGQVSNTDTLMDFGDNVDKIDAIDLGTPGYTNILWMISR